MADHFLKVPGARTLSTGGYKRAHEVVAKAAKHLGIAAVVGDTGLGKTFAVEDAASRTGLEHHRLVFTRRTTEKALLTKLIESTMGKPPEGTQVELERTATELLGDKPRLFWIDEAQDLSLRCVEYLRFFYDNVGTRVALVLVGGDGCWSNLERFPMLRDRIAWKVELRPLSLAQILSEIPHYHHLYSKADEDLLRLVYNRAAGGYLRQWAAFTITALDVLAQSDRTRLDPDVAKTALELLGRGG